MEPGHLSAYLMGRVYRLEGLTRSERDVLLALADHAHDDGTSARPGVPYLVWKLDLARSTIIEALRGLEGKLLIAATVEGKGRGNVTEYRLDLERGQEKQPFMGYGKRPKSDAAKTSDSRSKTSDPGEENVRIGSRVKEPPLEPPVEPPESPEFQLMNAWLKHAPPLQRHRESYFEASPAFQKTARAALRVYPAADIAKAIGNYATVLGSAAYRWSYSWTCDQFLARGLDRFVEEARPLENFRTGRAPTDDAFQRLDEL